MPAVVRPPWRPAGVFDQSGVRARACAQVTRSSERLLGEFPISLVSIVQPAMLCQQ